MRWYVPVMVLLVACGDAEVAPQITSFAATPTTAIPGVATAVTWSWTFAESPVPAAHCSVAGIGDVTNGQRSTLTLAADTTFELTCENQHGTDTAIANVHVANAPGAPSIATFKATPAVALLGELTQVTFTWSFASTTTGVPSCSIDNGIGAVADGIAIRSLLLAANTTYTLTCTNERGTGTAQAPVSVVASPIAPQLATFTANPGAVIGGVATNVAFAWTYGNTPLPAPECSIDHGVGVLTSGSTASITIAADTEYTLTCANAAGSSSRTFMLPAHYAPSIATFTATPAAITAGVATSVRWDYTFSRPPVPVATCTVDQSIGWVTPGWSSAVTIATDTVFTLTCTNSAGTSTRQLTIDATPPVAPVISDFTITPSTLYAGNPTTIGFTWSYGNAPSPAPVCSIDQNVGGVWPGQVRTVTLTAATTYTLTCTNAGGTATAQQTVDVQPGIAPQLASFTAGPSAVLQNATTNISWQWSYANAPVPTPTCAIDQGVGSVTQGAGTPITLSADRTYTITCTNSGGSSSASTTVRIAIAPELASFTATPTVVPYGSSNVSWDWTFANAPYPIPSCYIDRIGQLNAPATRSVYQTTTAAYQLACGNIAGWSTRELTLSIDECAAGIARCGAHAHCVDTVSSYDCECDAGFAGDGATCGAVAACDSDPGICDPHASCVPAGAAFACACRSGYVGDGLTCQRLPISFVTSTTGTPDLSTWADAGGKTGLAAGDAICAARAAAAGLPGNYVAWLSDSTSSAYCRVHGLTGNGANQCGLSPAPAPANAGPWVRPDGLPFLPKLDTSAWPGVTYYTGSLDEFGQRSATSWVWTGTTEDGAPTPSNCSDWTMVSSAYAGSGYVFAAGPLWTIAPSLLTCNTYAALRCMEVADGPALPPLRSSAKKVFVTSGNLPATMRDPQGAVPLLGVAGADGFCRRHARRAGLANADRFKAWLSTTAVWAANRFSSSGPWARVDGVVVGTKQDLQAGRLLAAIDVDETGNRAYYTSDEVWTGTTTLGQAGNTCGDWTMPVYYQSATVGHFNHAGLPWIDGPPSAPAYAQCNASARLYCFED